MVDIVGELLLEPYLLSLSVHGEAVALLARHIELYYIGCYIAQLIVGKGPVFTGLSLIIYPVTAPRLGGKTVEARDAGGYAACHEISGETHCERSGEHDPYKAPVGLKKIAKSVGIRSRAPHHHPAGGESGRIEILAVVGGREALNGVARTD